MKTIAVRHHSTSYKNIIEMHPPKLQEISSNEMSSDSEVSCEGGTRTSTKERTMPMFQADGECIEKSGGTMFQRRVHSKQSIFLFRFTEVALGHFLGGGSFGCVREVVAFQLVEDHGSSDRSSGEDDTTKQRLEKSKLAGSVFSNGQPRYASKQLRRNNSFDPQDLMLALDDMAWEASVLTHLRHPNIIQLHAIAGQPWTPSFNLVLDKLDLTLDMKIDEWKRDRTPFGRGLRSLRRNSSSSLKSIWKEQLHIALAVARAIRYLHQHRIAFRDLKPENCGAVGDTWKLFDFGLCRTLEPQHLIRSPDCYQATGLVGTPRYMAPEVFCNQLYGFSADAHSFGMFLWSLFAMEAPFSELNSRADFEAQVMRGGKRPPTLKRRLVPRSEVQQWMGRCWDPRPMNRPNFTSTCNFLEKEVSMLDETTPSS